MRNYRALLNLLWRAGLFLIGHHYYPLQADLFAVTLAVIFVCLGLQIYFKPVKGKREAIERYKKRHGIPLECPHDVDRMLEEGFFKP